MQANVENVNNILWCTGRKLEFQTGMVGVLGKTNVGKSTLINALLGRKALIVSDKPQTTRNRIRCVLNLPEAQIVFVDTPGLHNPVDTLSHYLIKQALNSLKGLDAVLYLVEPWGAVKAHDARVFEQFKTLKVPLLLGINKVDRAQGNEVLETIAQHAKLELFEEIVPLSCLNGHNLDTLIGLIKDRMPQGHPLFPQDQTTDRPLQFFVAELIREQVFRLTFQEIPYAVAVEVERIKERTDKPLVEIKAFVDVAHRSQRGLLIGKDGAMIKHIGQRARAQIESFLGTRVYLELKVRVIRKWNEDATKIQRLLGSDAQ